MLGLRVECLIPARAFPMDKGIIAPVAGAVRRGAARRRLIRGSLPVGIITVS